jgi:hypothetical protein
MSMELSFLLSRTMSGPDYELVNPPINQNWYVIEIRDLIKAYEKIRNEETCNLLQLDLIDHIWDMHGNDANDGQT